MLSESIPSRIGNLVLEPLPNGELAWLRRELDAAIADADQLDQELTRTLGDGPRFWITDAGRHALDEDARARATEALFGRPWPTVAEAVA